MIEATISILGSLAGVHSWFTGLRAGAVNEKILKETLGLRSSIERLTDHVLHIGSVKELQDITKDKQQLLDDKQILSELLTPVQESLGEDILSTAVVMTPEKLHQAISKDPWEVLMEIRPIGRPKKPSNPNMVPIVFSDSNQIYIGWQAKGVLPMLFDFEYEPNANLYLPLKESGTIPDKNTADHQRSGIARDTDPSGLGKNTNTAGPDLPAAASSRMEDSDLKAEVVRLYQNIEWSQGLLPIKIHKGELLVLRDGFIIRSNNRQHALPFNELTNISDAGSGVVHFAFRKKRCWLYANSFGMTAEELQRQIARYWRCRRREQEKRN